MKQASSVLLVIAYLLYSGKCQTERSEMEGNAFPDGNGVLHLADLKVREIVPAFFDVDKDVIFQLYTRSHPTSYIPLKPREDADVGDFSNQRQTKFIIHGWTSSPNDVDRISKAYLEAGDYNVIVVDWSKPVRISYRIAQDNMKPVGEYLASLIDFLVKHHGLRLEDVHIVGHSIGAHLAGVAGNRMKAGKPGRITGLDPAAGFSRSEALKNRLDVADGQFVDVIHTCPGRLGLEYPMGHVDFYVNGGNAIQPGCGLDFVDLENLHPQFKEVCNLMKISTFSMYINKLASKTSNWGDIFDPSDSHLMFKEMPYLKSVLK